MWHAQHSGWGTHFVITNWTVIRWGRCGVLTRIQAQFLVQRTVPSDSWWVYGWIFVQGLQSRKGPIQKCCALSYQCERICYWSLVCIIMNDAEPREYRLKRAAYNRWFASPLIPFKSKTHHVPRYQNLDLWKHVQHNIARFRLREHTMRVARAWQDSERGPVWFVRRAGQEKHAWFPCNCRKSVLWELSMNIFLGCFTDLCTP